MSLLVGLSITQSFGRVFTVGRRFVGAIYRHQLVTRHSTMATSPVVQTIHEDVITSAGDKRRYRGLELTNGMKVLLVSDVTTDKSAAALDVYAGFMQDPKNIPGLAHFCEHMLFLGTEKYPEENEYNKYLSEHSGSSNAFTSAEHTNYYFDIAPEYMSGALDRFAQFFLSPLFTASATEREVNAVNSENDKNLASDVWRLHQLERSTADSNHDYNRFGTGNKTTLLTTPREQGLDPRDELLKFHKRLYSSNIMGLTVVGKESLDELSDMVLELFSGVENKSVQIPEWETSPYGPQQLKKRALIVPVKDVRSLSIMWPFPDMREHYESYPGHYLGHLVGHEGPGSLLSELKARGWVNTLVGGTKGGARGFDFFYVSVDLTEVGIDHVDDIATLVYQYLNMLRREGPQEWVFQECRDLSAMHFRFKDKEMPASYSSSLSRILHDYPMKEVLSAHYLYDKWRPDLISTLLEKLTPDNMRMAVVGKKFKGQTNQREEWYDTEYGIEPIADDLIQSWTDSGFHDNLKLPQPNEFIPTNFEILPRKPDTGPDGPRLPQLIRNSPMTRLWFKQDTEFLFPKAYLSLDLIIPTAYVSPLHNNLLYMFVKLFNDALNEYSYDADLAGLHYNLMNTMYGMSLTIKGYNHKQPALLTKIMEKLTSFEIDPRRYEIIKEAYERNLRNFNAEQPHQHAIYYSEVLLSEQIWTKDELLDAADDMTIEKLKLIIPEFLSRLSIECLSYGNVTRAVAEETVDIIETILRDKARSKPLLQSQQKHYREVQLPHGSNFVYCTTNEVHKSSALQIYYQCDLQDTHNNVLLELFCQIISEPCFDILRTKEQLGYIVFSGIRRSNGVQGLRVIVQSDRKPDYVEKRIEAFLHSMEQYFLDMTADCFSNHVNALATKRLEKPKKMSSQNGRYWSEIICQQYHFDRDNIEAEHLRTLSKDDVMKFYKDLLSHDALRRHKMSVHVESTAGQDNENDAVDNGDIAKEVAEELGTAPDCGKATSVFNLSEFKRDLPLFPRATPFIKIPCPTVNSGAKAKL